MKRLIITLLGAVVALALALAVGAMVFVHSMDLKGRVTAALSEALGRKVEIKGGFGLTVYPIVGFQASDLTIANVPGGVAARMVEAKSLAVGVAVRPLFDKRLEIKELALIEPNIALEVDAKGAPNWIFTPAPRGGPGAGTTIDDVKKRINEVQLAGFQVRKGKLTYADARTHEMYTLTDIAVSGDLSGLDAPLGLTGEATFNKEPMKFNVSLNTPRNLIRGKPISLNFNLNAAPVELRFVGSHYPGDGALKGALSAAGPDLRRAAEWAGSPIGAGPGLKNFAVAGQLSYARKATAFDNATIKLDKIDGRGDFLIETSAGKPYVSGRFEIALLDLNPYLATAAAPAVGTAGATAPKTAPPTVDVKKPGWDQTPLDFSGLRALNMNIDLTTRALHVQKVRVDDSQMSVFLRDGFLTSTISRMKLYGGDGASRVELDARGEGLRFAQELSVDKTAARQLLADGAGFDALEGSATVTLNIRAQGRNQKEFAESLSGSGGIRVTDGMFRGVDFGGVTRTVKNVIDGKVTGANARTPFKAFRATIQIKNGVAVMNDFNLDGADFNVKGQGVIDIGRQTLDVRFTPRTVYKSGGKGFPLPVRGVGPWSALAFTTDIFGKGKKAQERVICTVVGGREC